MTCHEHPFSFDQSSLGITWYLGPGPRDETRKVGGAQVYTRGPWMGASAGDVEKSLGGPGNTGCYPLVN